MCPCVFIYLILIQNKPLKHTQQVRLFIISILFVSLSVFAAPKKQGFIDTYPLQTRSVGLSTQDSLRQAFNIPINDSLLGLDFKKRRKYISAITEKRIAEMTPVVLRRFKELLENITLFAKQNDDDDLALEIAFLRIRLLATKVKEQRLLSLDSISNVLKLDWLSVRVKYHLGIDYTRTPNRISEGFIYLFKALYILENILDDPTLRYQIVTFIGLTAYEHEQYPLSKRYFKKAADNIKNKSVGAFNNLALAYRGLKMLDSSNYYFRFAKELAIAANDSGDITIINGNIGENLFLEGEFEAAFPLLHADADYSLAIKNFGSASNALVYLSGCYLALGDPVKSERYLWEAYRAAKTDKDLRRMKPIYRQLANWSAYNGDAASALFYRDSLEFVTSQLQLNFNRFSGFEADKLVRLNASEVELLQKQQQQEVSKKVIWILVISGIFIMIITLLLFINFRSRKLLKEKTLALSNSQLKGKLEDATSQLNVYLKETQQKSLTEKVILTDADWREFLQFFNKVYPSFFSSIKQKYPNLSKAELRFCCLSYLSLSDKEMSAMLGVGRASIRVTRGRTRAKLQLTATDSLEELLSVV